MKNWTSNVYGELDSRLGSLKLGAKGQDGVYPGGPNGMGPGEYKRETKKSCILVSFQNWEIVLQISIVNWKLTFTIYKLQLSQFGVGKNGLGSSIWV